jgi:hypothetical protein
MLRKSAPELQRADMNQDDLDDYVLVRFVFDLRKEDMLGRWFCESLL